TVLTASAYFFCAGLQSSDTLPLTPGYIRFKVATVSLICISRLLARRVSSTSLSFVRTSLYFSSNSCRCCCCLIRSDWRELHSFFLLLSSEEYESTVSFASFL